MTNIYTVNAENASLETKPLSLHTHTNKQTGALVLLTLNDQLHHSLSGLHVETIILTGLAAVGARHLPGHVNDAQHAIVALHLHVAVRHWRLLICSGPQDDGLGLS